MFCNLLSQDRYVPDKECRDGVVVVCVRKRKKKKEEVDGNFPQEDFRVQHVGVYCTHCCCALFVVVLLLFMKGS